MVHGSEVGNCTRPPSFKRTLFLGRSYSPSSLLALPLPSFPSLDWLTGQTAAIELYPHPSSSSFFLSIYLSTIMIILQAL